MLIRSIKLNNFRQFKDTTIEFCCDGEKNVTVITGQNATGKTTLVRAFLWCLYRINNFEDKILLNKDEADYMMPGQQPKEAKVVVELEHGGYSYKITTKEAYTKNNYGNIAVAQKASTSILKVNGTDGSVPVLATKVEEEIESILSSDLKEYFFFDGETNRIELMSSKKNLTEAVSDILGLKRLEVLKDYYDPSKSDSVTSRFTSKLISIDDELTDNLSEKLATAKQEKEDKLKEIEEYEKQIDELNKQLDDLEAQLDANKELKEPQEEKKRLESEIESNKAKKENLFGSMISQINDSNSLLKVLFGYSFVSNNIGDVLNNTTFKSENSVGYADERLVDQLIERGYCLCGAKIENKNDAYNHLIAEKEHMEPNDYGKYTSDFRSAEQSNLYYSTSTLDDITDSALKLIKLIGKIEDQKDRLNDIKKKIDGTVDVGYLQTQSDKVSGQINKLEGIVEYIKTETIPALDKKIEKINQQIQSNSIHTEENEFTQLCLDYAQHIFDLANNKLTKDKKEIREKLEAAVNEIFQKMYHGNLQIKIDEKFVVSNSDLEKSTGSKTVQNFAFVTGLITLIKDKLNSKQSDELEDSDVDLETYPLVMDAPFSSTDNEHIENICKVLPNYVDQMILFVMAKDYAHASNALSAYVGKKYEIVKDSEIDAVVEEK